MWSEALQLLDRADRLHRQFFLTREPASWEPPVDIVEGGGELRLQLALPGVSPDAVSVVADRDGVSVSALRGFPGRSREALIHRLEIPYGRFERRIEFPVEQYELKASTQREGILTLIFRRKEGA
jgi:HSP20 family molecular chaperone IbpA